MHANDVQINAHIYEVREEEQGMRARDTPTYHHLVPNTFFNQAASCGKFYLKNNYSTRSKHSKLLGLAVAPPHPAQLRRTLGIMWRGLLGGRALGLLGALLLAGGPLSARAAAPLRPGDDATASHRPAELPPAEPRSKQSPRPAPGTGEVHTAKHTMEAWPQPSKQQREADDRLRDAMFHGQLPRKPDHKRAPRGYRRSISHLERCTSCWEDAYRESLFRLPFAPAAGEPQLMVDDHSLLSYKCVVRSSEPPRKTLLDMRCPGTCVTEGSHFARDRAAWNMFGFYGSVLNVDGKLKVIAIAIAMPAVQCLLPTFCYPLSSNHSPIHNLSSPSPNPHLALAPTLPLPLP
jgi:hypothetical protein